MKTYQELKKETIETKKFATIGFVSVKNPPALQALKLINELGIGRGIIFGKSLEVKKMAAAFDINLDLNEIVDCQTPLEAAKRATAYAYNNKIDILVKAEIQTADFLRAILRAEQEQLNKTLLHVISKIEGPLFSKPILLTDSAMIPQPSLAEKMIMIENIVDLATKLANPLAKIALIAPVETVSKQMPETTEAAILSQMSRRGQLASPNVDGPLSLDLALSPAAVKAKNYHGPIAGDADVLLMPNLSTANVFAKSLTLTEAYQSGSILVGAKVPAIITSRADGFQFKFNSILWAISNLEGAGERDAKYFSD